MRVGLQNLLTSVMSPPGTSSFTPISLRNLELSGKVTFIIAARKRMNNTGPSIDPCLTPVWMGNFEESPGLVS